jgi:hypothetical protein
LLLSAFAADSANRSLSQFDVGGDEGARLTPTSVIESVASGLMTTSEPTCVEEVVKDIEGQTRRILDFLGLPWDEACLRFHETKRPVRTASVNQVRQSLYSTSLGRWRKHAAQLGPLLAALDVPVQSV